MTQQEISQHLAARDFDERTAAALAEALAELSPELQPLLDNWLTTGHKTDFEAQGMTLSGLMTDYNMQYQAALLTMDWLIKEPTLALEALKHGIR